ncbi:MAG TPA: ATP-binding domain-containing protein [Ignavibacteriaceae bacterium]|nr:ATP-binding domain-containing protein [Ignavibacteriaceae bacterium]
MTKIKYNSKELKQIIDIGNDVINQLNHFSKNYICKAGEINAPIPHGMNDEEASLYVKKRRIAENIYIERQNLAQEPFISLIKIRQSDQDRTILISRGYTPIDYYPLNFPNVLYANKFSPYAAKVLTTKVGEEFIFNGIRQKILYRDRYFIPKIKPDIDGIQNTIDLLSGTYSIDSLLKLISIKKEDVTDKISEKIKEILADAEFREGLRRRIIENIQLRDQPILDEYQTSVYRTPLTSNLVITGSAGTGKTTVLIQRISLATKPDNLTKAEKISLSNPGLKLLRENNENWVLYTPTELLKNYLQQAFNKEGVPAYDRTIKVWDEERMDIGKNVLGFLKVGDNKGIFVRAKKNFFTFTCSEKIHNYSNQFRSYYLEFIEKKFYEAVDNLKVFNGLSSIPSTFKNIKSFYNSMITMELSKKIILLIDRLSQVREDVLLLRNKNDIKLDQYVNKIIREKEEILNDILDINNNNALQEPKNEEIIDDEMFDSEEEKSEILKMSSDEKVQAVQSLRKTISVYAERKAKGQKISLKGVTGEIVNLIQDQLTTYEQELIEIGQERTILKITNRLTSGYVTNLIQQLPRYYSFFRNEILLDDKQNLFNKEIKEKKYISNQEIDIIINEMLINTNKYFKKNSKDLIRDSKNSLLENIKSIYKNIVTVDESTDFSSTSLSCMYYLSNPLIKSYTLTGDLMQRITDTGIQKWEECSSFLESFEKKPLIKVYRQSYKLLNIASELYKNFIGEVGFESAFVADEKDPEPLIFNSSDRDKFKDWITNRIIEVYSVTKGKATIALFVAEDSEIDSIYDLIVEQMNDNNIEVEKCKEGKILSVGSKIRIFSIEYIKGLEFESVFFIDIDEIYKRKPTLVDKYLYVGLTRAGSFLAITYKDHFPKPLKFIQKSLKEGDWSWLTK